MASRRCRKHISNGSVLFMFSGLVLTVLLAAIVFSQGDTQRTAVGEFPSLRPDIASVLPSGAVFDGDSVREVLRGPSASSVFVVPFTRQRETDVGVIVWDASKGMYILASYVPLVAGDARVMGLPEMETLPLGDHYVNAVLAKGTTGVSRETTYLFIVENMTVSRAVITDAHGIARQAAFSSGPLLQWSEDPVLEDLDEDGVLELVVTRRGKGAQGEPVTQKEAYVWQGGGFALDEDLSWALDTTTRLFPEPTAEPVR